MNTFSNKWTADDSDEESDYENETPLPELDNDFRKSILDIKHNLYENTVLAPKTGTKEVHNDTLIIKYLDGINKVYILCLKAQKGIVNIAELNEFPESVRVQLQRVLMWINNYFSKNRAPDTIPYEDYIRKSLHEYQFVQNNSFE